MRSEAQKLLSTTEVTLPLDKDVLKKLGLRLFDLFREYTRARRPIENQWLLNLRQYLGVYDPKIANLIEEGRSRVYPKVTRVKCLSIVARLMSLLFPSTESCWDVKASKNPTFDASTIQALLQAWANQPDNQNKIITDKELKTLLDQAAETMATAMSETITDQLQDIGGDYSVDYISLVKKILFSAVLFGPGILKGPMTITRKQANYKVTPQGVQLSEDDVLRPYYEFVQCKDYYPDLSAKNFKQLDGQFQRHVFSRHQLRKLADRDDFIGDTILKFIKDHPDGNFRPELFENDLRFLSSTGMTSAIPQTKFEALEYWGYLTGNDLKAAGYDVQDKELENEISATVWLLDGEVIKAAINPYPEDTQMYHVFIFEENEVDLLGSGLPPICRDSQLAICSTARMLVDNASASAGPQLEVDINLLSSSQNISSVQPFKLWYRDSDNVNNTQAAVRSISIDSHIAELLQMLDTFMQLLDKETFVSQATGGDFDNTPNNAALATASGASMAYGNAALPFKDIVRNFDAFTMSFIHSLIQWNKLFSTDNSIKGDLQPVARGATSLIAKEVRAMALDNLSNTLKPEDSLYINQKELLKARIVVRDLNPDDIMLSDEEIESKQAQQDQQQQKDKQSQDEMMQATIRKTLAEAFRASSAGKQHLDQSDAHVFNSVASALESGLDPNTISKYTQTSGVENATNQPQPAVSGITTASPQSIQQPQLPGNAGPQTMGPT